MNGKLGKYSWTVDPKGWITVWVGPKEHYKTPCDGLVGGLKNSNMFSLM